MSLLKASHMGFLAESSLESRVNSIVSPIKTERFQGTGVGFCSFLCTEFRIQAYRLNPDSDCSAYIEPLGKKLVLYCSLMG